ncbi:GPI-linked NAD(P)(+)--arginine ADP-ribosyltransferase 1 [Pelodytes ibericus]
MAKMFQGTNDTCWRCGEQKGHMMHMWWNCKPIELCWGMVGYKPEPGPRNFPASLRCTFMAKSKGDPPTQSLIEEANCIAMGSTLSWIMWSGVTGSHITCLAIYISLAVLIYPIKVNGRKLSKRDVFLTKETVLDMALSSYDDQYKGCNDQMEAEIPHLFQMEYSTNREFSEAWDMATYKWDERKKHVSVPRGFKDEYAIALFAYTINGPLHRYFNEAVRMAGQSRQYYLKNFNFKVLHFYLTKALLLLDTVETPACHKVFRGIRGMRFKSDTRKPIRLGQFTSSSINDQSALLFGEDTFFSIQTCYGANIRNFSFFPGEEEVLIPPFEKFKVTQFTKENTKNIISLQSLEKSSIYNCEFVKERRCKPSWCPFNAAIRMTMCSLRIILISLLGTKFMSLRSVPKDPLTVSPHCDPGVDPVTKASSSAILGEELHTTADNRKGNVKLKAKIIALGRFSKSWEFFQLGYFERIHSLSYTGVPEPTVLSEDDPKRIGSAASHAVEKKRGNNRGLRSEWWELNDLCDGHSFYM